MEILGISHLGIVAKDNAQAESFFTDILGLTKSGSEMVSQQQVETTFIDCPNARLELLLPTSPTSPIADYIHKKGSGIHHVALAVDDLSEWLVYLKQNGVRLIDEFPRPGAHDTQIAFIHPHATGGILVELVEDMK